MSRINLKNPALWFRMSCAVLIVSLTASTMAITQLPIRGQTREDQEAVVRDWAKKMMEAKIRERLLAVEKSQDYLRADQLRQDSEVMRLDRLIVSTQASIERILYWILGILVALIAGILGSAIAIYQKLGSIFVGAIQESQGVEARGFAHEKVRDELRDGKHARKGA